MGQGDSLNLGGDLTLGTIFGELNWRRGTIAQPWRRFRVSTFSCFDFFLLFIFSSFSSSTTPSSYHFHIPFLLDLKLLLLLSFIVYGHCPKERPLSSPHLTPYYLRLEGDKKVEYTCVLPQAFLITLSKETEETDHKKWGRKTKWRRHQGRGRGRWGRQKHIGFDSL